LTINSSNPTSIYSGAECIYIIQSFISSCKLKTSQSINENQTLIIIIKKKKEKEKEKLKRVPNKQRRKKYTCVKKINIYPEELILSIRYFLKMKFA
jgi:hypothetical protein